MKERWYLFKLSFYAPKHLDRVYIRWTALTGPLYEVRALYYSIEERHSGEVY